VPLGGRKRRLQRLDLAAQPLYLGRAPNRRACLAGRPCCHGTGSCFSAPNKINPALGRAYFVRDMLRLLAVSSGNFAYFCLLVVGYRSSRRPVAPPYFLAYLVMIGVASWPPNGNSTVVFMCDDAVSFHIIALIVRRAAHRTENVLHPPTANNPNANPAAYKHILASKPTECLQMFTSENPSPRLSGLSMAFRPIESQCQRERCRCERCR